jgi:ligand-binding sensor domain-containing protein
VSGGSWRAPLAAVAVLSGLVLLARTLGPPPAEQPAPRPGWQTIRPPHEISALAVQDDLLWAGGRDGVFAVDRAGLARDELRCDRSLEFVRALLVGADGTLWIGHLNGLSRYDGTTCHTLTTDDGLPDNRVNALALDRQGRLWAGTSGGAASLDGGGGVIRAADGLLDDMVNVLLADRQGGLWFGSYVAPRGGLSYLKDGRWQYFSTELGLPHNNVTSLFEDRAGAIWVGTGFVDRGGAAVLVADAQRWRIARTLTQNDGLAGAKVRSVFQDALGRYWLGSEYDGLTVLGTAGPIVVTPRDGLAQAEVKAIVQDPDGTVWLASADGLTRVSAEAVQALEPTRSGT